MQYAPTIGYVRPFEKLSHFRHFRGRLWGVFNTPLRLGTCNSSKYRCDPPTEYVRGFKKWICFRPLRGRGVGRIRYAPTTGYVRFFEIPMRSPDRVRAILRNTDAIPQPTTCDYSRYRCDLSIGGVGVFGRWGVGVTVCGGDGRG